MDQETNWIKWGLALAIGVALIALGWKFFWLLVTLHVILCFVLCIVVLLQSGKAADLAGAFGGAGSQTAFGPRSAATFLTRATTWCFVMFILSTLSLTLLESRGLGRAAGPESILERTQKPAEKAPAPFGAPQTPVQGTPTPPPAGNQPAQPAPAPAQPPAKK